MKKENPKKSDFMEENKPPQLYHVFVFKQGREVNTNHYPSYVGVLRKTRVWINQRIGYFNDYGYDFEVISVATGRLTSLVFDEWGFLR